MASPHKLKEIKIDRILVVLAGLREIVLEELTDSYRRLHVSDINPPHGAVLCALQGKQPSTMHEIAGKIFRDQSTVTALVTHLAGLGYVKVTMLPTDKRKRFVALTDQGKELRAKVTKAARKIQRQIFNEIPSRDRKKLMEILVKIGYNLHSPHFSER
jgi:DNA-binding MarR family transcriptional regulator